MKSVLFKYAQAIIENKVQLEANTITGKTLSKLVFFPPSPPRNCHSEENIAERALFYENRLNCHPLHPTHNSFDFH